MERHEKEQLNMELVITNNNNNKEEKTMKGLRKLLVLLIAIVMVASMLVACGSDTNANQSNNDSQNTNTDVDEPDVSEPDEDETAPDEDQTDVAVSDEDETTPDEDVVDPEPVEEDNPNVIDGIDFTAFNNGEEPICNPVSEMNYDTMRVFMISAGHAYAILKDGDTFEFNEDPGSYSFYIYVPKTVSDLIWDSSFYFDKSENFWADKKGDNWEKLMEYLPYITGASLEDIGSGRDFSTTVIYEDGSEETITVTFIPAE